MNYKTFVKQVKSLLMHILFWIGVWWFYSYFFGFSTNNEPYVFWFSSILLPITIVNTYLEIYYLIPEYLMKKRYGLFFLYNIYCLIGSAFIISYVMFIGFIYMSDWDFRQIPPLSRSIPFILISVYLVVVIVSAFKLSFYNFQSLERQKNLENKFLQTQLQLKIEELKYLKLQIHPHFLFNTLNTMYGLALKKDEQTPEMILKLSSLLDYLLYQADKPMVILSKELNHIEDYVALEKMRFRDTLSVNIDFSWANPDFQLAPMLLIPFVENSFKHGKMVNNKMNVSMKAKTNDNVFTFEIRNNKGDLGKYENGLGLNNIKKRLELIYPNQHNLEINHSENEFIVNLEIEKNEKI